jgi:Zn-finger nucleic acid-binding protein
MTRCPLCSAEMVREPVGGIVASTCPSCAGVWLDSADLRALAHHPPLTRRGQAHDRPVFIPHTSGEIASCPSCPLALLRAGTAGGHRALACTSCHGVFLPAEGPRARGEPAQGRSTETDTHSEEVLVWLVEIASAFA